MYRRYHLALAAGLAFANLWSPPAHAARAVLAFDAHMAPIAFAARDIEAALRARQYRVQHREEWQAGAARAEVVVSFSLVERSDDPQFESLASEGFLLRNVPLEEHRELVVIALDAAGAMYGGLELAEQIRASGIEGVRDTDRSPYMSLRGTKFNIPLDLRTPSYSDMSDSAQSNIATVWDFDFWRDYLDALARDRYNFVALWNLHPFPSMVRVAEFADVALDEVWRSKARFEEDYSTRATDIVTPAMLANHEVVRKLTIAQKIDFWRRVMQYARDRNIAFYVVTWNIYTYGVDGRYGITDSIDNPKTVDYFRASVREMFHTYPLLAGIGLTVGENMGDISGDAAFKAKEDWVFATYGQGVLDAARAEPGRRIRLIHRQHEARARDIAARFAPLIAQPNVDFLFSFKYAQAHALSSTTQTFHRGYLESLGDHETLWTLRNDDALLLRWAAPDFVREFMRNIPREKSRGYYFGSDMWVWGRVFLPPAAGGTPPLEIEKHWLHFLLWGRLGYDPTLDDARIAQIVSQRFAGIDGARLLAAWQDASMIYPLVTGFHWANFDFQWYIEACRSRPDPARTASGFHSVETFITQGVHPGTDNLAIPEYVSAVIQGRRPHGTTPPEIADLIDARATAAIAQLALIGRPARSNALEFAATSNDIRLTANLGRYYAAKIRGATELALFRATGESDHQQLAIRHLQAAANHWVDYAGGVRESYGTGFWTNRVGRVDWQELSAEVSRDVDLARQPLP